MNLEKFSIKEITMILESLSYTKLKFEEYEKYPSYEYKQQRVKEVNDLILKIKELRKN